MASSSAVLDLDAATAGPNGALPGRTLRIDLTDGRLDGLDRTVVPASGVCPLDYPCWLGYTGSDVDRRLFKPHSLRYACAKEARPLRKHQDSITQHIWTEVRRLLEAQGLPIKLPSVVFDYEPLGEHSATLDLVFDSVSTEVVIHIGPRLKHIKVEKGGRDRYTFTFLAWSNSIAGDIFPVDCYRLPLDASNSKAIMQSLDHAVGKIGTVIGLGRIQIANDVEGLVNPDEEITRAYIKLARASMKLPFSVLVAPLPSHFVWKGVPYRLRFAGSQRREGVLFSADYPLEEEQGGKESKTDPLLAAVPAVASASALNANKEIREAKGSRKRSRSQ